MTISPAQSRAARGLLAWHQQQLADAASIGLKTINRFEAGQTQPTRANLAVIRQALEKAGVRFTETGGVEPKHSDEVDKPHTDREVTR